MPYNNGFSYLPHYKPGAQQGGHQLSSSNGYNTPYQGQAYPSMNGAPAMKQSIQQFHFAQTSVAHSPNAYPRVGPAGITATEGENFVATPLPQNEYSDFDFPAATTQPRAAPALDGSSMQQISKHHSPNSVGSYAGSEQNGIMAPFTNGHNGHQFGTRAVASTGRAVLMTDMQNEVAAVPPIYPHDGNRQHQANASRNGINSNAKASQVPATAPSTAGRGLPQSISQHTHPDYQANTRASLSTPSDSNNRSPEIHKSSSQEPTSVMDDGASGAKYLHTQMQAQSAPSTQGWPQQPVAGLKSKRTSSLNPESQNAENLSVKKFTQIDRAGMKLAAISFQNPQNFQTKIKSSEEGEKESSIETHPPSLFQATITKSQQLEKDSSSETHLPTVDGRNSEQPAALDPNPNPRLMIDRLKGQSERLEEVAAEKAKVSGLAIGVVADDLGIEIKQTIEKLLHYKAMHPPLFSKIWVQVKKENQISDRVPSDKEPSITESKDRTTAVLNGRTHLRGSVSTYSRLPSEQELSIEPLQADNPDLENDSVQRLKRTCTENISRNSLTPRQSLGTGKVVPTTTSAVYHSSLGPIKPPKIDPISSSEAKVCRIPPRKANNQARSGPEEFDDQNTMASQAAATPIFPTFWSEEKKWALAHAVKNKLASISRHPGTTISTEEIAQTLTNSSNFSELCESLKRKGFNVTAGYFSRWWFSTVMSFEARSSEEQRSSDVDGPLSQHDSKKKRALPNSDHESSLPVHDGSEFTNGYENVAPLSSHESESAGVESTNTEFFDSPHNAPVTDKGSGNVRSNKSQLTHMTPFTMKERAKKRGLSEFIDLSSEFSDSGAENRRIRARVDVTQDANGSPERISSMPPTSVDPLVNKKIKRSLAATEDEGMDLSQFTYAKSQQDLLHSNIIVRPMDIKNDALRRSTYNPKTIARDILTSAAKHQSLPPLNHHLKILQTNFGYVNHKSDLATFRWDLVDPGGSISSTERPRIIDLEDTDDEVVSRVAARTLGATLSDDARRALTSDISANKNISGRPFHGDQQTMSRLGGAERRGRLDNYMLSKGHKDVNMTTNRIGRHNGGVALHGAMTPSQKLIDPADFSSDSSRSARAADKTPRGRSLGSIRIPSGFRPREVSAQSKLRASQVAPSGSEPRRRPYPPVPTHSPKPTRSGSTTPLHARSSQSTLKRPSGLRNSVTASDGIAVVIQSPRNDSAGYAN